MKTIVFEVMPPAEAMARLQAEIAAGKFPKHAHRTFVSAESMARLLTPLRWTMLQAMTGAGPLGVRELARRLGRDVRATHADATGLTKAGVVERTPAGKYLFPFDRVKVRFELRKAA